MAQILVVDDDIVYLDELSQGLRSMGHTVSSATSANEALSVLDAETFDIAICDTIMTGGGALSFLHEVRMTWPDFPVIIMTGRREIANSPLFKEGMREADAKIEKSASLSEIEKVVRSLLL